MRTVDNRSPQPYLRYLLLLLGMAVPLAGQAQDLLVAANRPPPDSFYSLQKYGDSIPALQGEVSLDLNGVTVREALQTIADKAGLGLSYNSAVVARTKKQVTMQMSGGSTADALQTALAGTNLDAVISQRGEIVIVEAPNSSMNMASVRLGNITGQVVNTDTGEPLVGASVSLRGTGKGTSTDANGRYRIEGVEPGTHTLVVDYMGYRTAKNVVSAVSIYRGPSVDFTLKRQKPTGGSGESANFFDMRPQGMTGSQGAIPLRSPQVLPGLTLEEVGAENFRLERHGWQTSVSINRREVELTETNDLERLLQGLRSPSILLLQTGKISGRVTDADTGEPIPGVNVVIEGEHQGATTNAEGYYTILNVPPGTYTLRATFVGYQPRVVENVGVNIDLTTTVDFELQEEAVGLEEVTVEAQEPVVKPDVSANVSTLDSEQIQSIPTVTSISEVVGLQAGAEGLSIRGSGADELSMVVDGMSMRDGRTNSPFTGISFTSVDQVQVQTGGFNAEYGNVRSGLVNVATREGPRSRYTADVIARYSAPQQQHFGIRPDHPDAYWYRPYLDPDVAFVGTHNEESPWDQYTQDQYPEFDGWNAIASDYEGLTPEQAQEVFKWNTRKDNKVTVPDYTVDASVGGPVPAISRALGNLRFMASYRTEQQAFFAPMDREAGNEHLGQVKVTSNLRSNMKLQLLGMYDKQMGYADPASGGVMADGDDGSATNINLGGMVGTTSGRNQLANPHYENLMDITRQMVGAELTHTVGSSTFYTVRAQRMYSDYLVRPHRDRRSDIIRTIGGLELTEAPWGFRLGKENTLSGIRAEVPRVTYDSSTVAVWQGNFDLTSQFNRFSQLKAGVEYLYNIYDIDHFEDRDSRGQHIPRYEWVRYPRQGAAYLQNKLEFQGMIANVGLRLDYFNPGGQWYEYAPFAEAFTADYAFEQNLDQLETVEQVDTKAQYALSPRLGVSFPITTSSKLFFNYGHFRQMLDPMDIYQIEQDDAGYVGWIGNPGHPMPRTTAYELGYEHNLLNKFLVRVTGYYKALDNQSRLVDFVSGDGRVIYSKSLPNNYEDIRGVEFSLEKVAGRYVRGFANYTYMAEKSGNFGFARYYENPIEQREFERTSTLHYQNRPSPEPFARVHVEFFTPGDFGPGLGGFHPLDDWRLSFLGSWRAGDLFTWDGGGGNVEEITDNVRWSDEWDLDLRLTRSFDVGYGQVQLFADIQNVLNIRHLERFLPFTGREDRMNYMRSLHLPESVFDGLSAMPYQFVPGNDEPGDYRKPGVAYQPIEVLAPGSRVENLGNPHERPFYYEKSSGRYMSYQNGSWMEVDQGTIDRVLEDKAYIDMPNLQYRRFLNPRRVTFGLRLNF